MKIISRTSCVVLMLVGSALASMRANAQDVVNLARVHQPNEGVAHDDDVQISRGKGGGKLGERLVRQAQQI